MNAANQRVCLTQPFEPVYDANCSVLILGSFPSVESRRNGFFYGHPKNRFWRLLSQVYETPCPVSREEKLALLLDHKIALWDVIESCDILGSSDATIKNVVPADLSMILRSTQINRVLLNGSLACRLYEKYQKPKYDLPYVRLPSTSPANAAYRLERLVQEWLPYLPR